MDTQRTPAQWFSLLAGTFLVVLGVLALALNQLSFEQTTSPEQFLIWNVVGWNTILWIAMGVIGLLASLRLDAARSYGLLAAVVFGALAVWGFVDGGLDTMGILAIGTAGNITHAAIAGLGLLTGLMPSGRQNAAGIGHGSGSA